MSRRDDHFEPITGPGPKTKRRSGVMPTRKELDQKKKDKDRRPARWDRSFDTLAYISHS